MKSNLSLPEEARRARVDPSQSGDYQLLYIAYSRSDEEPDERGDRANAKIVRLIVDDTDPVITTDPNPIVLEAGESEDSYKQKILDALSITEPQKTIELNLSGLDIHTVTQEIPIEVIMTDILGNVKNRVVYVEVKDTTPPIFPMLTEFDEPLQILNYKNLFTSPPVLGYDEDETLILGITSIDPRETYEKDENNNDIIPNSYIYFDRNENSDLFDGEMSKEYKIDVYAVDESGNESERKVRTIQVMSDQNFYKSISYTPSKNLFIQPYLISSSLQFDQSNQIITGGLTARYNIDPSDFTNSNFGKRPVVIYEDTTTEWKSYPEDTSVSSIDYWMEDILHKLSINLDESSMFRLITASPDSMRYWRDGFGSRYYRPYNDVDLSPSLGAYWASELPKLGTNEFPLVDVSGTTETSWKIASVDLNGVIRRGLDAYKITKGEFFFQPPKLEDLSEFLSNKSFYLVHLLKAPDGLWRFDPFATHRIILQQKP